METPGGVRDKIGLERIDVKKLEFIGLEHAQVQRICGHRSACRQQEKKLGDPKSAIKNSHSPCHFICTPRAAG